VFSQADQPAEAVGFDLASLGFSQHFISQVPKDQVRFPRINYASTSYIGNGHTNENRPVNNHTFAATMASAPFPINFEFKGHFIMTRIADWTDEVRHSVLEARQCIRDAQTARATFRRVVRGYVTQLRGTREPLSAVLRRVRAVVQQLEFTGAIAADDGWLEADVVEWTIEDYENPA